MCICNNDNKRNEIMFKIINLPRLVNALALSLLSLILLSGVSNAATVVVTSNADSNTRK